jgi:predicted nucleotidyltransferase
LKQNYWTIDNFEDNNTDNINVSVSNLRLSIDKDTLSNTIQVYEKNLDKFLERLIKLL